jgi:O-antigen/teichoic acid export membrane protein
MDRERTNVVSHAAVYLLARGLPGLVAFCAIPLFSRMLEPSEYGRYALALATVGLLYALLFQWLRLALVRYLAASADGPGNLKSTLVTAAGGLALAAGVITAAACAAPVSRGYRDFLVLCWALLVAQAAFELCCEYTRAMLRPWQFMRLQLARSLAFVGLGVLFVVGGAGWWGPLAGMGVGMALAVTAVWRRDWAGVKPGIDLGVLVGLARYGVPLAMTVALTSVIGTSDRYLIAWMKGEDAAGLYSVAVDFTAQTITLLMTSIHMAMFPVAVRAWDRGGAAEARKRMAANASMLMALGVPCVIGLGLLAPGVAHTFLGDRFRNAAVGIIPLVALGTFLAGMKNCHFDAAFQFVHRTVSQVWIVLAAAVLNVALNMVAIPRWGIEGAAGASAVAYVAAIAMTVVIGRGHFAVPLPAGDAARVLLAAGVMGMLLVPVRQYVGPAALVAQVAGGAVVYGAVLLATDFMGTRSQWTSRRRRTAPRGFADGTNVAVADAHASSLRPAVPEVG